MDNNEEKQSWFSANWKLILGIVFLLAFIASFFIDFFTLEIKAFLVMNAVGFTCWNFYKEGASNMILEWNKEDKEKKKNKKSN